MHPDIFTSPDGNGGNECGWLWRSSETKDYDILGAASSAWQAWNGKVAPLAVVAITCNEGCSEDSDCHYHGICEDSGECTCDSSHTGDECQFEKPCPFLATEKSLSIGKSTFQCDVWAPGSAL